MRRLLLLTFVFMLPGAAQQLVRVDPDCPVNGAGFAFTAGGQSGPGPSGFIDNRATGCSNWTLTYEQVGAGALSIVLQSAPDNGGVPGTWVTFAGGTIQQGSNPNTGTPYGIIQIQGYAPFVRVHSNSQSANLIGFVFGSRSAAGAGTGVSSPCPGTTASPCDVQGITAVGAATNALPIAIMLVDSNTKAQYLGTAQATGDNDAGFEFPGAAPMFFNGINYNRGFVSTNQVRINVSAGTAQKIVAQVSAKTTSITHISFAMDAAADASIVQGTTITTPCDTTRVVLAGPYKSVTALALDFSPASALRDSAVNLDTCLIFSGSVTAGGVAMYAQF